MIFDENRGTAVVGQRKLALVFGTQVQAVQFSVARHDFPQQRVNRPSERCGGFAESRYLYESGVFSRLIKLDPADIRSGKVDFRQHLHCFKF
jgi:hypothetical protein